MTESVNVSLSDLFDAGLIHEGDLVSVTLPHQYNEGENKYTATGTMKKGGVSYGAEVFTSLCDFHQFLKLKRARELRAKGISAPKNPMAPNDSTISKTTTIEGTPLVTLSRKYHAMKQLKNSSFPPSKKKIISIPDSMEIQTLDPSMGDEEDSEQISDASIDPFNDEDMDMSPLPDSEGSEPPASVVSGDKQNYPPQELEYPSFKSTSSATDVDSSLDKSPSSSISGSLRKKDGSEELDLELDELLEEPNRTSLGSSGNYPQTAEMLSLNMDNFTRADSIEIRKQHSRQTLKNQPKPSNDTRRVSPSRETLLKNAAKQKIKELQIQNKKKQNQTARSKSPTKKVSSPAVSPSYSPPRKFRKTSINSKRALFKDSDVISVDDSSSLPSPDSTSSSNDSIHIIGETKTTNQPKSVYLNTSLNSPELVSPPSIPTPTSIPVHTEPTISLQSKTNHPPVIMASGLSKGMLDQLKRLINKIGGEFVRSYDDSVSHVVIFCDSDGVPKTTIKLQQGILSGCWVVSFTWVLESFKEQKWIEEKNHIAQGFPGIISGRKNKLLNKARLFSSKSFYLHGTFTAPSKNDITSLIRIGGGTLLDSIPPLPKTEAEVIERENSTIILCPTELSDDAANDVYFKCGLHPLAVHYIIECILQFEILPDNHYRFLESTDDSDTTVPMSLAF